MGPHRGTLVSFIGKPAEVLDFLEAISKHLVSALGTPLPPPRRPGRQPSVGRSVNVAPIRLRKLGEDLNLMRKPEGQAPKGIWIGPKELRDFYTLRQSWKGKRLLLRLIGRWLRAIFHARKDRSHRAVARGTVAAPQWGPPPTP